MPSPQHDAGRYGDLPPVTRRHLHEVDDAADKIRADAAPEYAATRQHVIAAYAVLNAAHKLFRESAADVIAFMRACGAQVDRPAWWQRILSGGSLGVITLAETALAFPGIRYALGHEGDIELPWEDPLALVASAGLALASLKLAKSASREWMAADRATLHEPVQAAVSVDPRVPDALLDGDAGRLVPESLLAGGEPGATVVALPARDPGKAEEAVQARFGHVVRDSVRRRSRLTRFAAMAGVGVLLWAGNGSMRAQYVATSPERDPFGQVTGLGVAPVAPAEAPGTWGGLELVLIGLGVAFFVAMILISTTGQSALVQREGALRRTRDDRLKELAKAVKVTRAAIVAFEEQRSIVEYAETNARTRRGIAAAGGTR